MIAHFAAHGAGAALFLFAIFAFAVLVNQRGDK